MHMRQQRGALYADRVSNPPDGEMTNERLATLLTGALIVAALWFRVLADVANPTSHATHTADAAGVSSSEKISSQDARATPNVIDEFGKICANTTGSLVKCSEIDEDTICIRTRAGANTGARIDCGTDEPIPADEFSASRAKNRSPY